ncbi:type I polyketide synthase [Microbacterium sp. SLBN-146]|uniref:type I polyketide synthase n=1 Tax=Microbacterium sp. SLBN-146 TaxID=2768457 RepID=UPI00114D520C|nr:type I polyketide synthase [Microbacterium sp. SLBN-146]TQJ31119.1 acyl transferase domain-containing protein [Microbacterium sp. SLBN-146]
MADASELIAIIGMSIRLPGASSADEFWTNLRDGVVSVETLSPETLEAAGVTEQMRADPQFVPVSSTLDGVDRFDAKFFGYSPREAEIRDPQGRLFLESCYHAFEDAGYNPADLDAHVGVFGGMANSLYGEHHVSRNRDMKSAVGQMAIDVSNSVDYLCTTVSYRLGLHGPSVNVQTACSTALVAIHLACQSLRAGESDFALAGAVEVELPLDAGYHWSEGGIFAKDGRCRPFDAEATGTIFGSGVGVVLLRRLDDALEAGDAIIGVIRGSAVNNDGSDRAGFTAPSVSGQAMLITEALADADVPAGSIDYIEAHATGTVVGDPIEVAGLRRAYAHAQLAPGSIPIGSVKGNIGHMGPAAGMAGLAKVLMSMRHGTIPPTVNLERINPRLELESSPFFIPVEPIDWPEADRPRRAGISSFGIGGTNAHIIVEAPPAPVPARAGRPAQTQQLLVSARTPEAFEAAAKNLADAISALDESELPAAAAVTQTGRAFFAHRGAVAGQTIEECVAALRNLTPTKARAGAPIVALFPGQGSQFPGMLSAIAEAFPVAKEAVESGLALLATLDGDDPTEPAVRALLLDPDSPATTDTRVVQPALFLCQVACLEVLRSFGIQPTASIGHSVGEIAAACAAGALAVEDGVRLVHARARLMSTAAPGSMLAVMAGPDQIAPHLVEGVEFAAFNSPVSTTLSGPTPLIEATEAALTEAGIGAVRVTTSHAFHSAALDGVRAEFERIVDELPIVPPTGRFVSNLTGEWADAAVTRGSYWAAQMRSGVQFEHGVRTLLGEGETPLFVELAPTTTLSRFVAAISPDATEAAPFRKNDTAQDAAAAPSRMWVGGADVDWRRLWSSLPPKIHLPGYPFARTRYWVDPDRDWKTVADARPEAAHSLDDGALGLVTWRETAPRVDRAELSGSRWLIVADEESALSAEMVQALSSAGAVVTDRVVGHDDWTDLAAAQRAVRSELSSAVAEASTGSGTLRIVHVVAGRTEHDRFTAPFHIAHALSQALESRRDGTSVHVTTVTANLWADGPDGDPSMALAIGPTLLAQRELAGVTSQIVDTDGRASGVAILRESAAPQSSHPVRLRGGRRWECEHVPFGLPDDPETATAPLREGGVYLITGGFGGIGRTVADWIARSVRATIVLVARTPLPEREQWGLLLDDPDTPAAVRDRLEAVLALESAGSVVDIILGDIADEHTIAALRRRHPEPTAVFHCAGVAGGGMLAVRTADEAERVLRPKVLATNALWEAYNGVAEMFVLFSSSTAINGTFGMVDYCSANAYMDAFARTHATGATRIISIGWSGWSEVGMVVDNQTNAPEAYRALQRTGAGRSVEHPLLSRWVQLSDDIVEYETDLAPGGHWTHAEHRIDGREVLVGAAIVEAVRAALAHDGEVELRDVVYLLPVTVVGETMLVTRAVKGSEGWECTVDVVRDGADRQTALVCRAVPVAVPSVPVTIDLDAIAQRCDRGAIGDDELLAPGTLVDLGAHWRRIESTLVGEKEELARISLAQEYWSECAQFVIHPSLLDLAVADAQVRPLILARGDSHLPLGFDRITVHAPLEPVIYSHIRHLDDVDGDVVTVDVDIYDASGRLLVSVERFTTRKAVRGELVASFDGLANELDTATTTTGASITPAFGIAALARIIQWGAAPHVLVCPEGIVEMMAWSEGFTTTLLEDALGEENLGAASSERLTDTEYVAPRTTVERELCAIWGDALGSAQVGIDDDFFDIGGNSLVAVQLASRMRARLEVSVPIAHIFEFPTVRALSSALSLADAR